MECDKCGKELAQGSAFCTACGQPVGSTAANGTPEEKGPTAAPLSDERGPVPAPPLPAEQGRRGRTPPPPAPPLLPGEEAGGMGAVPPVPAEAREGGGAPPPGGETPPQAPAAGPPARRPRTSGFAIASLVMGILGWTCLFFIGSVLAIIFGAVAKSQIKNGKGELKGGGMATAGLVLGIVLVALMVLSAAIVLPLSLVGVGPTRTVTRTVEQGSAATVNADLEIRSGSLKAGGGASELMRGRFTYNVSDWKPEIEYNVSDGRGALTVSQLGGWHWAFWNVRNDWDIAFKDGVPINLSANVKAGSSRLQLDSLDLLGLDLDSNAGSINADASGEKPSLRNVSAKTNAGRVVLRLDGTYSSPMRLDVEADAGSIDLSLAGKWKASVTGSVETSAGSVTVRLPRDVGVIVNAESSFGTVQANGLKRGFSPETFVNDAYGKTAVTIELDVNSSAGSVKLLMAQ